MKVKEKNTSSKGSIFQLGKPEERSILDLFPYKDATEEGIILTREDHYQRYYRVSSTDVEGLSEQEQVQRMDQLTTVMRTYVPNLKLTSMTTETNLSEQIIGKRQLLEKNRLEQTRGKNLQRLRKYEKKLVEEIQELKKAEQERPDLSFFFVIEGKTFEELKMKNRQLIRSSGVLGLKPVNKEELIVILNRMNNMNDE
ncbi:hypothetical protein ACFC3P_12360 [Enterococcus thailandicus]|uniref:hypothetical protein n=1 Tax=Enterococcus thailandicus TaxID=417368 RepID=UPI0039A65852